MSLADRRRIRTAAQITATTIVAAPMLARSARSLADIAMTIYREANFGTPRGLSAVWQDGYNAGHADGYQAALAMHAQLVHDRADEAVVLGSVAAALRSGDDTSVVITWDGRMRDYVAAISDAGRTRAAYTAQTVTGALRTALKHYTEITP